jgi:dCTP deaminase
MILSDRDIKKALQQGRIRISPKPDFSCQLGSCSIDLRLGREFQIFEHSRSALIDPRHPVAPSEFMREVIVRRGEPFILQPGDFVLATTVERIGISYDLLARLEGRSSLGRLGIVVHSTASVFEPGWDGTVVMELGNMGRMAVALYPGMRICALTFEELSSPVDVPYDKKKGAKYLGQKTAVPSKIGEER